MFTLQELMTPDPYTLTPENSAADAVSLMKEKNIRHIPILNQQAQLAGLVTQRDLLKISGENNQPTLKIADFMTTKLSVVSPQTSLRGAALYLQQHKHGCLPIVDGEKLVGIITDSDYVAIAINLLEQIEATEPEDEFD